ncbi:MAG TPA: PIN domain-containing protein [Rhizomicrobium sp.]|nr:PIN domain-containing protein [Rhizomicrobium sp.]
MPGSFFDSNVLVYLASGGAKAVQAEAVVAQGGTVSVQVLNEVANVARRKMRISWADTRAFLLLLRNLLDVRPVTSETHEVGLLLAERYKLQVFDAMIAAAALLADCDTLFSENMHHGMVVNEDLRITNPFRMR